jgi:hypothetical protein
MNLFIKTTFLASTLMLGVASPLFAQVPDLTKDTASINREFTYNLGATGLRPHDDSQSPDSGHPCRHQLTGGRGGESG